LEIDQQEDQENDGKRMLWISKKLEVKNWKEMAKDRRT
jgi:hypothetical protein